MQFFAKIFIAAGVALFILSSPALSQVKDGTVPPEWTSFEGKKGDTLYARRGLPGLMYLHYYEGPRMTGSQTAPMDDWLKARKYETYFSNQGRVERTEPKPYSTPFSGGRFIVRTVIHETGRKVYTVPMVCQYGRRTKRLEFMVSAGLFAPDRKVASYDEIYAAARHVCGRDITPESLTRKTAAIKSASKAKSSQQIPKAPSKQATDRGQGFTPARPIPGLVGIWSVGDMDYGYDGGMEARWFTIMTFDNGMASTDFRTILTDGVAASRRRNPGKWRTWRIRKNDLQLGVKSGGFTSYYSTVPSKPGSRNYSLNGCWTSSKGISAGTYSGGGGATSFASRTWCFTRSGRFSNQSLSAATASAPGGGGAKGRAQKTGGTYRVDGNVLQVRYDDGRSVKTSFGVSELGDKTNLFIGGGIFR